MANTDITPLFGSTRTAAGQRMGGTVARATRREAEQIAGNTEIAAVTEQAHAFLTAQAMTNVATLVNQAQAHMQVAPAGAQFYEALITSYAIGAGQRLNRGL